MDIRLEDDRMCFACGDRNPIGLKLEFERTPEGRMHTIWKPAKEHHGFKGIVHGGLVATVLDEVMIQLLYRSGIEAVTAEMETRFIRPLAAGRAYRFEAWLVEDRGRLVTTEAEATDVRSGERVASGRAKCARVGRGGGGSKSRES